MYKKLHINRELNDILGKLGHTDKICIADVGLPIPSGVKCIDLSLAVGSPSFIDVYNSILDSLIVEDTFIAEEFESRCDSVYEEFRKVTTDYKKISHEEFKALSRECKVIIRSGQATPYANVILTSKPFF